MKNYILPLLIILICSIAGFGQKFEKGKLSELKGLTKIVIDYKSDVQKRDMLVAAVKKAGIKNLQILDPAEEDKAEIIMVFVRDEETNPKNNKTFPVNKGIVTITKKDSSTLRTIITYASTINDENLAMTKFVKKFVKTYKTTNHLK